MQRTVAGQLASVYRTWFANEERTMVMHPWLSIGLRWAGWTVLGLVAFVVCCRVVNGYGQAYGMVLAGLAAGAAWVPTERCRRIVGLFANAVRRHMPEKAAAFAMGLSKSQFSEGVNCAKQLSLSRAADVGDEVWLAFAVDLVQQSGQYVVMPRGELSDLVMAVHAQTTAIKAVAAERAARTFDRKAS